MDGDNLNDGPRCPKHQDVTMRFVSGTEPHHNIKVPHWRCELWVGGGVCGATRPAGTTAPKASPMGIEDVRELLQAARESVGGSDGGGELVDSLEMRERIISAKDATISSQERHFSEFRREAMSRHTFENKPGESALTRPPETRGGADHSPQHLHRPGRTGTSRGGRAAGQAAGRGEKVARVDRAKIIAHPP